MKLMFKNTKPWSSLLRSLIWFSAYVYIWIKKHPSVIILFPLLIALVILLFDWGVVCLNIQSSWHIKKLCKNHTSGNAVGSLCMPLCINQEISSLSCHSFHVGKETVISAKWNASQLIFKLPRENHLSMNPLFWADDENYFLDMLRDNIKIKFNTTVDNNELLEIQKKCLNHKDNLNIIEMKNLWLLMQDNEFVALNIYEKYDFFPKLIGSCGPFYATERLPPVSSISHTFSLDTSLEDWKKRVDISIKILEFLQAIDEKLSDPLVICDVKIDHFVMNEKLDKVKYVDLDSVHPKSVIDSLVADKTKCNDNRDCDFFDCRSLCNKISGQCDHGVVNNNLQAVCEKVFLGWAVPGRILLPGLLLGPHTPSAMSRLLQACANPNNDSGTPRAPTPPDIGQKLYNMLKHLKKQHLSKT